jgi:hypothetical protein
MLCGDNQCLVEFVKQEDFNLEVNLELMCKIFADTWNNSDNRRLLSAWSDTTEDIKNEIRIAMMAVIDNCIKD